MILSWRANIHIGNDGRQIISRGSTLMYDSFHHHWPIINESKFIYVCLEVIYRREHVWSFGIVLGERTVGHGMYMCLSTRVFSSVGLSSTNVSIQDATISIIGGKLIASYRSIDHHSQGINIERTVTSKVRWECDYGFAVDPRFRMNHPVSDIVKRFP
jgi:hypothetical protein